MRKKWYSVVTGLQKNSCATFFASIFYAENQEDAILECMKSSHVMKLLVDGYSVVEKNAVLIDSQVCPHNSDHFLVRVNPPTGEMDGIYVDLTNKSSIFVSTEKSDEFMADFKALFEKHFNGVDFSYLA